MLLDMSPSEPDDLADSAHGEWDERYAVADQVWSGEPNGALVDGVQGLNPGRALDVGCGEGADAVWLAQQGWEVTGLDVSEVALERAAVHACAAGVAISWLHAGLLDADLDPASFDLVSAQYPALRRRGLGDDEAERRLISAVGPGGTLLVVHHANIDREQARAAGFDPDEYVSPADVARLLDAAWQIETEENRPRHVTSGAGSHHAADYVLRARLLASDG